MDFMSTGDAAKIVDNILHAGFGQRQIVTSAQEHLLILQHERNRNVDPKRSGPEK